MPDGSNTDMSHEVNSRIAVPKTLACKIAAEAIALRRSHPQAPALDVLDLVMTGHHHQRIDFDGLAPPAPFALVIAEVFDRGTDVDDWARWSAPGADPALRSTLLGVWTTEVWPKFLERYSLG